MKPMNFSSSKMMILYHSQFKQINIDVTWIAQRSCVIRRGTATLGHHTPWVPTSGASRMSFTIKFIRKRNNKLGIKLSWCMHLNDWFIRRVYSLSSCLAVSSSGGSPSKSTPASNRRALPHWKSPKLTRGLIIKRNGGSLRLHGMSSTSCRTQSLNL